MRILRIAAVTVLTLSLAGSALAGDLAASAERAVAADAEQAAVSTHHTGAARAEIVGGASLFAAGMTVGLFAFINNKNGQFSEFGEAAATNKKLGAAGISLAFAGGMMMFLGSHTKKMPSLAIGKGSVEVGKQLTW